MIHANTTHSRGNAINVVFTPTIRRDYRSCPASSSAAGQPASTMSVQPARLPLWPACADERRPETQFHGRAESGSSPVRSPEHTRPANWPCLLTAGLAADDVTREGDAPPPGRRRTQLRRVRCHCRRVSRAPRPACSSALCNVHAQFAKSGRRVHAVWSRNVAGMASSSCLCMGGGTEKAGTHAGRQNCRHLSICEFRQFSFTLVVTLSNM